MKAKWSSRKSRLVVPVERVEADIQDLNVMHNYCFTNEEVQTETRNLVANTNQSVSDNVVASPSVIEDVATSDPWDPEGVYAGITDHVLCVEKTVAEESEVKGNRM